MEAEAMLEVAGWGSRRVRLPLIWLGTLLCVLLAKGGASPTPHQDVVATTTARYVNVTISPHFNHLAIDRKWDRIYVGAVNMLYQFSSDLILDKHISTGPQHDQQLGQKTDNVNKVLLIQEDKRRLIMCGTARQGQCSVRNLNNLKLGVREVDIPVVAKNATASTVAFLSEGPNNRDVINVGVTFSGLIPNVSDETQVPAVIRRSLEGDNLFKLAGITNLSDGITYRTRIDFNSSTRERYPVNYVYGFSSGNFSYFLTTQPTVIDSGSYYSKLVRICNSDEMYTSYTEIPITCKIAGSKKNGYNLVQAASIGKAGYNLASELGVSTDDDVLFAAFSQSISLNSSKPSNLSALCVYSLKTIKHKFLENIKTCFRGIGTRGLNGYSGTCDVDFNLAEVIDEEYCGLDMNPVISGEQPVEASPVAVFSERLTAVATSTTWDFSVVFAGTAEGHLKKIVVESATNASEYGDIVVDENSPVNSDLFLDRQLMHLYVMTERKLSKVKVQGDCDVYKSCSTCLGAKNPYCGWAITANKCTLRSNATDAANKPITWVSFNKPHKCPRIDQVIPNQFQRTEMGTVQLHMYALPYVDNEFECEFSVLNQTIATKTIPKFYGLSCQTPSWNILPHIPNGKHHMAAKLSVRTIIGPSFISTNFTFFDCNTFTSCTECVTSPFPCDWCIDGHRCTHDSAENCRNDIVVTGISKSTPSYRSGPDFCPTIGTTSGGTNEIIVPFGDKKAITVKVRSIFLFMIQTGLVCQFNIEGRVRIINAQLLGDTIYCDPYTFTYASQEPKTTASFAIMWGGSKPLDNPNNTHILIYRCSNMADNCGKCFALPEKFGCGWCQNSNTCEVGEQCEASGSWLDRRQTCPKIEIHKPQLGNTDNNIAIESGKNSTNMQQNVIEGIKTVMSEEVKAIIYTIVKVEITKVREEVNEQIKSLEIEQDLLKKALKDKDIRLDNLKENNSKLQIDVEQLKGDVQDLWRQISEL